MFQALLAHPQEENTNGTWYVECVLCQLAAPGLEWKGVPLQSSNPTYWFHYTDKCHNLIQDKEILLNISKIQFNLSW
jgi:hypothetical protein